MINVSIHKADEQGNILTLLEDLTVAWKDRSVTVPERFESDGASVPEFLWEDVSPAIDPRTLRAAIVHDYLYRIQPEPWTRLEADELFYDFIRADGLSWWKSQKAYWGLRIFGGSAWEENADGTP